jgi:DNA mismatch repair protein MutL
MSAEARPMIGSGSVLSVSSATPLPLPQSSASRRPVCILPEEVASRIAAGEVVERPASVVKELTENALDAGAKTVHVELEGGGRECVRVTDDGCGMGPDDLRLSVLPHATSKLVAVEELERMATLGFRGEALPSIASVSRFTLTSRLRSGGSNDAAAWRVEVCGGEPKRPEPRPAGAATGSTVEVRDLFFNVPARAKFLKGAGSEAAACVDALLRLTLTRPDVTFTLRQGRQEVFSFLASAGLRDGAVPLSAFFRRARDVLGRSARDCWRWTSRGPATRPRSPPLGRWPATITAIACTAWCLRRRSRGLIGAASICRSTGGPSKTARSPAPCWKAAAIFCRRSDTL